jgi:hypothetical protein
VLNQIDITREKQSKRPTSPPSAGKQMFARDKKKEAAEISRLF